MLECFQTALGSKGVEEEYRSEAMSILRNGYRYKRRISIMV